MSDDTISIEDHTSPIRTAISILLKRIPLRLDSRVNIFRRSPRVPRRLHDTAQRTIEDPVRAAPRAAGARVDNLDVVAAGDGAAVLVEGGLAGPAGGTRVVGWLVLALCVAGDVGLVELVGWASGWERSHAHVLRLCLAGAASAEWRRVCCEDGCVLALG